MLLASGLVLLLPLLLSLTATHAQTPSTRVRLSPSSQTVPQGTDVVVDVMVDDVADMAAFEFHLSFERSVLSFESVTNGPMLGSSGRPVSCLTLLPPDVPEGTVRFGCATLGSDSGISGSGRLATVRLSTSCAGASELRFLNVILTDPLAEAIDAQSVGANATVSGGNACPPPVPTSTPTPTPTGPTPTPTSTATPLPTPTPLPRRCGQAPGPAICVVPPTQFANPESMTTVQVAVDGVSDFGAFQFDLMFDDTLIAPVEVAPGPLLGSTGRTVLCLGSLEPGRVRLACSTLGAARPGPTGSGVVAEIRLEALELGSSVLHFGDVILIHIDGVAISGTSIRDGVLQVIDGPLPTATPTPTPTGANTPTPTSTPGPSTVTPTPPSCPDADGDTLCDSVDPDDDNDGCSDTRELGPVPSLGGQRDPLNFWDFFDTPAAGNLRDGRVTAADLFRVVERFGATGDPTIDPRSEPPAAGYHTAFDRAAPLPGADPWDARPANGNVAAGDIFSAVVQFGHTCVDAS